MIFDFEYVASPTTFDDFIRDYWEQEPLVIHRNDPKYFQDLFSFNDIEEYLRRIRSDKDPLTIILGNARERPHADKILNTSGFIEPHLVMNAYSQGDTIALNRMQRFWPPFAKLCRNWEFLFRHPVEMKMYLTPPGSQGFAAHFEGYDICVLQLHGSKRWKLYSPQVLLPLHPHGVPKSELASPTKEVELRAGDFLYMPRGCVHENVTSDESSMHLSVLIHVYSWFDLLSATLESAARRDKSLREAIRPGVLLDPHSVDSLSATYENFLKTMPDLLDLKEGLKALERKFLIEQQPLPDSRFTFIDRLNSISINTTVFKTAGSLCSVSCGDRAEITFCGNFLRAPRSVLPAFEFISNHDEFKVSELPGDLSDDAKVTLVRRLVKEGLLGIRENSDPS